MIGFEKLLQESAFILLCQLIDLQLERKTKRLISRNNVELSAILKMLPDPTTRTWFYPESYFI